MSFFAALGAFACTSTTVPPPAPVDPGTRFEAASFAATHNSYSGESRGSMEAQLELGVRFLELDIHDDDFSSAGFQVGHDDPGHSVDRTAPNPASLALADWLAVIASWSRAHPDHAPITLGLDLKDSMVDPAGAGPGALRALDEILASAFGELIYPAADLPSSGWPTVETLEGRIVAVLSGHEDSRLLYLRSAGAWPSIGAAAGGRIAVGLHDDARESWVWTGSAVEGEPVTWTARSWVGRGEQPAVALFDEATLVVVMRTDDGMVYRAGTVSNDSSVDWWTDGTLAFPAPDRGTPSIAVLPDGRLSEVHVETSTSGELAWTWTGSASVERRQVFWNRTGDGRTNAALHPREVVNVGGVELSVRADAAGVIEVATNGGLPERVRFPQRSFVEIQPNADPDLELEPVWFAAGDARKPSHREWAQAQRRAGRLVRLWHFNTAEFRLAPTESFPATDVPEAEWYGTYCAEIRCVE